ncbi:hypothetical protein Q1695_014553 [Nippostrongylus brasiliensis]|nr:hypothetical protein Q1695_014553 [Nippostrongylus brasiliensis]
MLLHLAANQLKMSYVGNVGVAMVSNGHLEKLTDSGELDDEQYDRIRRAGGTVDENNIINGVTPNCHQLGFYSLHPIVTPKPINKSISITADTDYVIIATWAVWEFLSGSQIAAALATSVNPQVAAKMIQDALQACDYNGNSCVVVIRVLKPELAFGSTTVPQPTVSTAVPPMRVDSNGDQETTLQKIEQRLEKISEVIAKMEDDSTTTQDSNAYSPGRKLYNRIVAEEKVAGWMLSPSSSSVLPPPDPTSSRQHLVDELKSKVAAVEISPEAKFRPSFVSLAQVGAVTVVGGARRPLQIQPGIDSSTDPNGVALNPARETVTSYDEIETLPGGVFIAPLENVPVYPGPRDSSGRYSSIQKDFSSSLFSKESLKVDHLPVSRSSHVETLDQKLHSGSMPESLTDDTCSSTARSSSYLDIQGSSTPPDREPLNLTETRYYDYSSSYDCPSTSSNSGVYSVQAATRERSFDYYSHTKVRPYDGYTSLEVSAPSRTTTPFLEYASPYRRKMSVIEEVSEGPQRSSSEERVPSASPPPLPDSEVPRIARRFS